MKLSELYWHRITPLHIFLWPLSVLYRLFLLLKKLCYWLDIFPSIKLPVPVIIVDSISVDDGGKTPLLLWFIDVLLAHGFYPGIVTRGNPDTSRPPLPVTTINDLHHRNGKAFLFARLYGESCPVWAGNDRIAVAQALLNAHPKCNVIICNDGMPYYRLERDIEVIIVDFSEQSFGNGLLLPAGPLRMTLRDLGKSTVIVTNNMQNHSVEESMQGKTYNMRLINETAYNVRDPALHKTVSDFRNESIQIVTDADNARWLYEFIQKNNLNAELHSYTENHRFIQSEIDFDDTDAVLMPEEIALQCKDFAHGRLWAIPQKAWINSELQAVLLNRLKNISTE